MNDRGFERPAGRNTARQAAFSHRNRLDAALTGAIGALDGVTERALDGALTMGLDCATWLSHTLQISSSAAYARVHQAGRQADGLPAPEALQRDAGAVLLVPPAVQLGNQVLLPASRGAGRRRPGDPWWWTIAISPRPAAGARCSAPPRLRAAGAVALLLVILGTAVVHAVHLHRWRARLTRSQVPASGQQQDARDGAEHHGGES